jgi:hypothetical protein
MTILYRPNNQALQQFELAVLGPAPQVGPLLLDELAFDVG